MRHVRQCLRITLCAIVACQFQFTHATPGQPGTLDASWGTLSPIGAGKVMTPIGSGLDVAAAIAVQPDGKVLLAGYCYNGGPSTSVRCATSPTAHLT